MGLFDSIRKLFGGQEKRDTTPNVEGPRDISLFPSYQNARQILGGMGTPEDYINKYYEQVYQPTANLARYNYQNYQVPELENMLGAQNLGGSTAAAELYRKGIQERELNLANLAGQLKAQGYESGLGERARQLSGYEGLLGQERQQQGAASQFAMDDYNRQIQQANARRQANQQVLPNIITAGTGLYDIGRGIYDYATGNRRSTTDILMDLIKQRRAIG